MKHLRRAIWGAIFVAAAVIMVLNSFGVINFNIFFDGWWTLFIIVPSFTSLIRNKNKIGSIFTLIIGILLLLSAQEIISWDMIWKIMLPLLIASIGIKMIVSSFKHNKADRTIKKILQTSGDHQRSVAIFCGTEVDFKGVNFEGADLITVFGGIDCDLRGAIIEKDTVINICCVFGGVETVQSNKNADYTIYIDGICAFGGVDIK